MDALQKGLQEDLLILLCFDKQSIPIIINNVSMDLFDNIYYKRIATVAKEFYLTYKEAIGDHLADSLEEELNHETKGKLYEQIILNIYEKQLTVVKDYVINNLDAFIKRQQMKSDIRDATELLLKGKVDEAEAVLYNSRNKRIEVFSEGIFYGFDRKKTLSSAYSIEDRQILTGINALDRLGHVPTKGELFCMVGRAGSKKSWACVYLAKMGILQKKKVLYITLELDEERLKARFHQAFFGLASKEADLQNRNPMFGKDSYGKIADIEFVSLPTIDFLNDESITSKLSKKFDKNSRLFNNKYLLIKEFYSGSLTMDGLRAYLENLEAYHGWKPDMIILDYLGIMKTTSANLRLDLRDLNVEFRGLAKEKDFAAISVYQANRVADDVKVITRKHLSEDFSAIMTADVLITLNCTDWEKFHGLLRIYIEKGRNGRDSDLILLSQNVSIGQFCLDSALMSKNYYSIIEAKGSKDKEVDGE